MTVSPLLAAIDHPSITYEGWTTVLFRWTAEGLAVCDRWVLSLRGGLAALPAPLEGPVLLDVYYLAYLLAFAYALGIMIVWRRQGFLKVKPHVPYDGAILAIVCVLVGAKAAYILVYNPAYYFGDPPFGPRTTGEMLERIFLNWSGMASHGAAAGVVIGVLIWHKLRGAPVGNLGDAGCTAGAFGAILIRTANFMNGELYGRDAPEGLPFAMRFLVSSRGGNALYVQDGRLFEEVAVDPATAGGAVSALVPAAEPYRLGYELIHRVDGAVRHFAADAVPPDLRHELLRVVTTPRHPSQLYQLLLEGVLLLAVMLWFKRRVKRAGVVAGIFFIGYATARIVGELFRQPDVQFQSAATPLGTILLGLSMGQLLSFAMLTFGIGLTVYFARRGSVIAELPVWPPDPPAPAVDRAARA